MERRHPLGDVTNKINPESTHGHKRSRKEPGQPHLVVEKTLHGTEHGMCILSFIFISEYLVWLC